MFGYSLPQKALTSVEEEAKAMWDALNDAARIFVRSVLWSSN